MSDIQTTLNQRQSVHGDFTSSAHTKRMIMLQIENSPNWKFMHPAEQQAIAMIVEKLGRILHGDHLFTDHWHDLAGYATLGEKFTEGNNAQMEMPLEHGR